MPQEIYEALRRPSLEKPLIASVGGMAASGAFYVAIAATQDRVRSHV